MSVCHREEFVALMERIVPKTISPAHQNFRRYTYEL
jgi:hypothetical protein